jgi:ring-1,2-phenylacetyl-CoA epoxidase subunit PaaC
VNPELKSPLAEVLLALADDEMVLAHRDSEWTGHAPILEEDIAFANIALDEMGHAALWYRLVAELRGEDPEQLPDRLIFHRPAQAFLNVRMVEQPKGDWAFTIVRQFLFDAAEQVRLKALVDHPLPSVAHAAAKILKEERYHERHSRAWVRRLGLGTQESRKRMSAALDVLWPMAQQLFQTIPAEAGLAESGTWPASLALAGEWRGQASGFLEACGLAVPATVLQDGDDRRIHTVHLGPLVAELQSVARLEPEAEW